MKTIVLLFVTLFYGGVFSQEIVRLGSSYQLPIYQSEKIKVGGETLTPRYKSKYNVLSTDLSFRLYKKKKHSFYLGFSYQYIRQVVEGYLDSVSNPPSYVVFSPPLDAVFVSHSLGVKLTADFKLYEKNTFSYHLGASSEIYIWEFFKFKGFKPQNYFLASSSLYDVNLFRPFGYSKFHKANDLTYLYHYTLPSINLSIENRFSFNLSNKMILTAKVSLGTNLYAKWVQFKKYIWLGTGLELSFGKKKTKKEKESTK